MMVYNKQNNFYHNNVTDNNCNNDKNEISMPDVELYIIRGMAVTQEMELLGSGKMKPYL